MNKKRKNPTPPGTIPHKERTQRPLTAITNGRLFGTPRTAATQGILSGMVGANGSNSGVLPLFLAIQNESRSVSEFFSKVHAQEVLNADVLEKEVARLNKVRGEASTQRLEELRRPENQPWSAQPPPSDIWSMMRTSEPMLRVNGDVFQTINIPAQVMFNSQNPIRINCKDDGALKEWMRFFDDEIGIIPINTWGLDCYFTTEQYGQWFPLEYWDGKDLKGIASLEPTSVWVGHHMGMGYRPMSMVSPEAFDEAKWRDMQRDIAFSTFTTNLNIQTFPTYRIPIPADILYPVFTYGKKAIERYAIPHLARAYDHMLYRMMLFEYRQGILESWIAQVLMLVVKGYNNLPPGQGAINAIQQMLDSVIGSHKGDLVVGYDVTPHMLKPDALDMVMGVETWIEATQTIFRALGFDIFLDSGEIAGTHGRGGGVQVEVSVQVAMERWKSLLVQYFRWCTHIARKYAEKNDRALLEHLPTFQIGPSAYETQLQIERAIKPLFAAGILSPQTALERADENYAREIANLKEHQPNKGLMEPPSTFAQSTVDKDGNGKTTRQQTPGRPRGVEEDDERDVEASIHLRSDDKRKGDLRDNIRTMFAALLLRPTRDAIVQFASELESVLRAHMGAAYDEGFRHQGGFGDRDDTLLSGAIAFQVQHLLGLKRDLLANLNKAETIGTYAGRVEQYAGAVATAYVLGTQAAAKANGAKSWQRVLHPELSETGPCQGCISDSSKIHPISEPFTDHPDGVCSMQSIMYHFGDAIPMQVRVPFIVRPGHRVRRVPLGGLG